MNSQQAPLASLPTPHRIAVVCLRRLGDVLLTAPLIRTLRVAYPQARIEALVFAGTEGALAGNPDLDALHVLPQRGAFARVRGLWHHYDVAFCTQAADRPQLISAWIARRRISVVPRAGEPGYHWKRWLSWRWTELPDGDAHTVVQYLRLAEICGLPIQAIGIPPQPENDARIAARLGADWASRRYAVLHPAPKFRYKEWTADGWRGLLAWLGAQGLEVMITGSGDAQEMQRAAALAASAPGVTTHNLAGALQLGDLSWLIGKAQVFVGPDTSITHLAALTGAPTVALFGPSSPTVWGPWPQIDAPLSNSPWQEVMPLQQRGNVWLLQGIAPCVPCKLEGCERRLDSYSHCLDELPLVRVTAAVAAALQRSANPTAARL
ncbi:MAG: putative lipopolysaccharide heptosyltransferase [Nevskia sp.]|nr:putative lipopolysaccharide heptosyltransferase [Nevskia sp.]